MGSIIGFTITKGVETRNQQNADFAQHKALSHFPHLRELAINIGNTKLSVWGHDKLADCVHHMPDGSVLALIGPQAGSYSWEKIQIQLTRDPFLQNFVLPWEGRVILIKISADGTKWTLWNDWIGSIPVFHAPLGKGWIASTLEPIVVEGVGFTPNDIFLPGLIMILTHGHTLGDWTLYNKMKVVPPDCMAEWDQEEFKYKQYFTIQPSFERWERSWDDLIDETHELTCKVIGELLKTRALWIVPLSSGLDSRIIAAVGAELGTDMRAYTWGTPNSEDAIYARQIARVLDVPWKWIYTGTDYLEKYVQLWADLFGSAMHFHGMYQMPFLDALTATAPAAPIVSGYLGDSLAGYEVHFQSTIHSPNVRTYHTIEDGYLHWRAEEIGSLLKMDTRDALEEIASEIDKQRTIVSGPWFQRIIFLDLWGRQRHFTYFQAKLDNYWRGGEMPYLNRSLAKFCFSLPRVMLDHRILQKEMLKRYYGKIAVIPGSFAPEPLILTGRYLLKQRIRQIIPPKLCIGPFRDFSVVPLSQDAKCLQYSRDKAIWPIRETWKQLGEWINIEVVEHEYQSALQGNLRSARKLQSIQTLAYRLMDS